MTPRARLSIALALVAFGLAGAGLAVSRYVKRQATAPAAQQANLEYFCAMHPQIVREKPGDCPICGMKLEKRNRDGAAAAAARPASPAARRILFYRHPMNPAIRSQTPAKDDMGMDFVPVYEETEPSPGTVAVPGRASVTLPADRVALLGVRSEPVGAATTGGALRTVGRVVIDERRRQVIHARYDGYVEDLHVDFTGQAVKRGQPLLSLYSPALVAAQQEYLVARRAQGRLSDSSVPGVASGGRELVDASRQRLRAYDLTPAEIAALESSGAPRRTLTLRSPVTGLVLEKMVVQGMKISPSDRLYEIADLTRVWILAEVYERDLGAVRVGLGARVTSAQQPGTEWRGRVTFVSPIVKPETRTVEVRVEAANPSGVLRPEMFVDVQLEGGLSTALFVPESAVIRTGERTLVFVDQGEGRYAPREVSLGARTAGGYAVQSGVSAGERVVVSANFLLDSESSLRSAISALAPGR